MAILLGSLALAPAPRPAEAVTPAVVSCTPPTGPQPKSDVSGGFFGQPPDRLTDTRSAQPVPAGCWLRVQLPAYVPADAEAVVVTLTAVRAPTPGFLTAHDCDSARQGTSNLNVHVIQPTSNTAIVPVGSSRELCVYSQEQSDVLVDLFGWFAPGGSKLQPMTSRRALDTRSPELRPANIDGKVAPGERVQLDAARLGVPPEATAVMVNFTATQADGWGFLTGFPCLSGMPPTSNINYDVGIDRAGTAIVALDSAGLCLELGLASSHVIVDVVAWLGVTGGVEYDLGTTRVADTRSGTGVWSGRFAAGETRRLDAIADMPLGTEVASLGIVATQALNDGFIQVAPCGTTTPTSSLNFEAFQDITNFVAVPVADDGSVCVTASAPTHLVIDVFGGFGGGELVTLFDVGPFDTFPAFDPKITDYVAYCTDVASNQLSISIAGPPGSVTEIVGQTGGSTSASAAPTLAPDDTVQLTFRSATGTEEEYWVRCLPPDFPRVSANRVRESADGWYLVANNNNSPGAPGDYAAILDSYGVPVWYREAPDKGYTPSQGVLDFQRWSDGSLAWVVAPGLPFGLDPAVAYERFSLDGTAVASHTTIDNPADADQPLRPLDHHDLVEMPNGNLLMISYPVRDPGATTWDCNLPGGGGPANPADPFRVLDAVIQEIDPTTGALVKEWSADVLGTSGAPKIDLGAGGTDYGEVRVPRCFGAPLFPGIVYYDPIHVNSVAVTPDGSQVLFTARDMDAVYAIDWASGDIAWKLGGTTTAASLAIFNDPGGGTFRAHDVNVLPNGNVTVFDNRAQDPDAFVPATGPARYVEYRIDQGATSATLVRSLDRLDGSSSGFMGSARVQPDGGVVVGWGSEDSPVFSEFDPNGMLAFEVTMNGIFSYRVTKEPLASFDRAELRAAAGV